MLICAISVYTIIFIHVTTGESVSLKELRYEIMYDTDNEIGDNNRRNLYETTDTNITYDIRKSYYELDEGSNSYLLCDRNIFNFTDYEKFYIEYYNPSDNDIYLVFKYSFEYGNETLKLCERIDKDYLLYEYDSLDTFNEYYPLSQIALYYSGNSDYPNYRRMFATSPAYDDTPIYYRDSEYNISLENPDSYFEKKTITIDNNFNAYYSQLAYYCEIWITGVEKLYIKDYGFSEDGILKESYVAGNRKYIMLYGSNQYYLYYNLSQPLNDWDYMYNIFTISAYDYDTLTFIRFFSFEYNPVGYTFDVWNGSNFETDLSCPIYMIKRNLPAYGGSDNYYAATGQNIFLNKNSIIFNYKTLYNIVLDNNDLSYIEAWRIQFIESKIYYGYSINTTFADIEKVKMNNEIESYENDLYRPDIVSAAVTSNTNDRDSYRIKINGDWGIVDGLRKALNIVLEIISDIIFILIEAVDYLVIPLQSIITAVESIITPLDNIYNYLQITILGAINGVATAISDIGTDIVNAIGDIAGDIETALTPLFGLIQTAVNAATAVLTTITGQIVTILSNLATILINLADIIGLLTLAGWLITIFDFVTTHSALLVDWVIFIGTQLVAYIGILVVLITQMFDLLIQMTETYLIIVTLISMIRLFLATGTDTDIIPILKDYVDWFFKPLIIFGKAIIYLVDTLWQAIPL